MAEKQVFHFIYRPPVNQELLALREKYEKIRPSTLEWLRSMKRKFKARIEVIRMNNTIKAAVSAAAGKIFKMKTSQKIAIGAAAAVTATPGALPGLRGAYLGDLAGGLFLTVQQLLDHPFKLRHAGFELCFARGLRQRQARHQQGDEQCGGKRTARGRRRR